jgi:hypothetical protein
MHKLKVQVKKIQGLIHEVLDLVFPCWSLRIATSSRVRYSCVVVTIHNVAWVEQVVYYLHFLFSIHVFLKVVGLYHHPS